jgi:hypothetical protein
MAFPRYCERSEAIHLFKGNGFASKKARTSFLKKRRPARGSKKLLLNWANGGFTSAVQITKSFLRAFFQKSAAFFSCLIGR